MLTTLPVETVCPPYDGVPQEAGHYRQGVSVREIGGVTVYSHGGYWGTWAAYVPALDLSIGVSVTQQENHYALVDRLVAAILSLVRETAEEG